MMWSGKSGSQRTVDPFFFFSGDHLNLDRKTVSISVKNFFGLIWPKFGRKNHLNLSKDQSSQNQGQDRLILSLASKRPPIQIPGYATVAT